MKNSKIVTYIGFAIRSNKVVYGIDALKENKKKIPLIVFDGSTSENTVKEIVAVGQKNSCPVIVAENNTLAGYTFRPSVKVLGVCDENLASAILKEVENAEELKLYSGGLI